MLFVELLGGLGDAVISLRAIQSLARSHPDARLTVLTFPPGAELLEGDPLIHEVVRARPDDARGSVEALLAGSGGRRWDLVVSNVSYDGIGELVRGSGAGYTVTNLWRSPPPDERVGERFVEILVGEGLVKRSGAVVPARLHLTEEERARAKALLTGVHRPLVFLIPDAGMEVKRWPEDRWGKLGRSLVDRFGAGIVVPVGSDPEGAGRVARLVGGAARVWPRGTLRGLAAALSHADLVVGADTGPARISAALGVPTITLFGPSHHGRYGQPPPHADLQGHPGCPQRNLADFTQQPCWYGGACTLEGAPSWRTCLEDITVSDVLLEAGEMLGERTASGAAVP
jgi:ADP-heptose:LPS heptosyltransferase